MLRRSGPHLGPTWCRRSQNFRFYSFCVHSKHSEIYRESKYVCKTRISFPDPLPPPSSPPSPHGTGPPRGNFFSKTQGDHFYKCWGTYVRVTRTPARWPPGPPQGPPTLPTPTPHKAQKVWGGGSGSEPKCPLCVCFCLEMNASLKYPNLPNSPSTVRQAVILQHGGADLLLNLLMAPWGFGLETPPAPGVEHRETPLNRQQTRTGTASQMRWGPSRCNHSSSTSRGRTQGRCKIPAGSPAHVHVYNMSELR